MADPPITSAPVPPSIAGIPQPVFAAGDAATPATPINITGTPILPPPQVGFGEGVLVGPAIAPAPVPPSLAGFPQPQYATGSGTAPTAASLFPAFTAAGPSPPIVLNATQAAGSGINFPADWIAPPPPPLPTTPGIAPIVLNGWGLYAGPNPGTPFPKLDAALVLTKEAGEPAEAHVAVHRAKEEDEWPPKPAKKDDKPAKAKKRGYGSRPRR